jgi:hypothetical protein
MNNKNYLHGTSLEQFKGGPKNYPFPIKEKLGIIFNLHLRIISLIACTL